LNNKAEFVRLCEKYERHIPLIVEVISKMELYQLLENDDEVFLTNLRDFKKLENIKIGNSISKLPISKKNEIRNSKLIKKV